MAHFLKKIVFRYSLYYLGPPSLGLGTADHFQKLSTQLWQKAITNGSGWALKMMSFILPALVHRNERCFEFVLYIGISLTSWNFKHLLCLRYCVKCWRYRKEVNTVAPQSDFTNWWGIWMGGARCVQYVCRWPVCWASWSSERMIKEKDFLKRVVPGRQPQKDKKEISQASRWDSLWWWDAGEFSLSFYCFSVLTENLSTKIDFWYN